ncbi:pyruvate ferredoxin oxidoreductase delta subunit [Anaerobacterium chartisolvens]|uniref:Pyruvate ferredoxin oxidoreductase delta subunit n=1 Tax=Anaerobacterium chartisolvens TaxID=1297424 RepID=A0A369B3D1_9FIRM|nr:4Fe-4S binding protein [Anaerobacterium chartisolvens]RCX16092.1 pyruvate ferredoxin oxidoreductase delta subunit [Anaerobacterium chartisolvens]
MSNNAAEKTKIQAGSCTWKEISEGGMIPYAGNAELFKTGDWRSMKPIWLQEKCKQCLLCYPVCPDTSILVDENGKRIEFDYDHCKGCGVCVKVCPFKAIDFVEEGK